MNACMYVCIYICMYICMYVFMYVCIYVCMYVCMYVMYVCICMHVCMYVCVCLNVCMYVCMYVYMCVCIMSITKRYYKRHKAKQIIKIIPTKSSCCSQWLDNHHSAWHWLSFSLLFNFYIQTQQYVIPLISERILAPSFVQCLWQESFCYPHVLKDTCCLSGLPLR